MSIYPESLPLSTGSGDSWGLVWVLFLPLFPSSSSFQRVPPQQCSRGWSLMAGPGGRMFWPSLMIVNSRSLDKQQRKILGENQVCTVGQVYFLRYLKKKKGGGACKLTQYSLSRGHFRMENMNIHIPNCTSQNYLCQNLKDVYKHLAIGCFSPYCSGW